MGRMLNLVTPLHTATKRDYMGRMNDDKVACSLKAREYEADYWDGDRRFGYGGYRFVDRPLGAVCKSLIATYRPDKRARADGVRRCEGFRVFEVSKIQLSSRIAVLCRLRK